MCLCVCISSSELAIQSSQLASLFSRYDDMICLPDIPWPFLYDLAAGMHICYDDVIGLRCHSELYFCSKRLFCLTLSNRLNVDRFWSQFAVAYGVLLSVAKCTQKCSEGCRYCRTSEKGHSRDNIYQLSCGCPLLRGRPLLRSIGKKILGPSLTKKKKIYLPV